MIIGVRRLQRSLGQATMFDVVVIVEDLVSARRSIGGENNIQLVTGRLSDFHVGEGGSKQFRDFQFTVRKSREQLSREAHSAWTSLRWKNGELFEQF